MTAEQSTCLHLNICDACGRCENCGTQVHKKTVIRPPPHKITEVIPPFEPPRAKLSRDVPFAKKTD